MQKKVANEARKLLLEHHAGAIDSIAVECVARGDYVLYVKLVDGSLTRLRWPVNVDVFNRQLNARLPMQFSRA